MLTSAILLAVFILLIIFGGYFGAAETAFTAMNEIKIRALAENGDKRAKSALYIADNFERALVTILIGNNITHIGAGAVATTFVLNLWREGVFGNISEYTASFLWGTVVSTFAVFLFAEMIPKAHANDRSETLALRYARSLRLLMKILYPLAALFGHISSFVSKLFKSSEQPTVTEEELYDIIDTAEEEGVVDEERSDIMKSAIEFTDTAISEVMTMRSDIFSVDVSLPVADIVETVKNSNHSRIPVYSGSPDNIVGILNIRAFLRSYIANPSLKVRKNLTAPYFVSPDEKISDVFYKMSKNKKSIAIVGKVGEVQGLVTIEDFVEEIVGEIFDEDDVVDENFMKLGGNRFLVGTEMSAGEAMRRMGLRVPDKKLNYKKLSDFIYENLGHYPEEDESFTVGNLEVTAEDIEDNVIDPENKRIDKIVIRIVPKTEVKAEVTK